MVHHYCISRPAKYYRKRGIAFNGATYERGCRSCEAQMLLCCLGARLMCNVCCRVTAAGAVGRTVRIPAQWRTAVMSRTLRMLRG
jgi:hypothetical protein